jgi:hypothetical protein
MHCTRKPSGTSPPDVTQVAQFFWMTQSLLFKCSGSHGTLHVNCSPPIYKGEAKYLINTCSAPGSTFSWISILFLLNHLESDFCHSTRSVYYRNKYPWDISLRLNSVQDFITHNKRFVNQYIYPSQIPEVWQDIVIHVHVRQIHLSLTSWLTYIDIAEMSLSTGIRNHWPNC